MQGKELTTKKDACKDCEAGQFSDKVENEGGCTFCQPGRYQTNKGQKSCQACEKGRYQSASGATGCTECAAGQFNAEIGMSNETSCKDCAAGRYCDRSACEECTTCMEGSVAHERAENCTSCDFEGGTEPNEGVMDCVCRKGFYKSASSSPTRQIECLACETNITETKAFELLSFTLEPRYYSDSVKWSSSEVCPGGDSPFVCPQSGYYFDNSGPEIQKLPCEGTYQCEPLAFPNCTDGSNAQLNASCGKSL